MFCFKRLLLVFSLLLFPTLCFADSIAVSEKVKIEKFSQKILDEVVVELLNSDISKEEKVDRFKNIFIEKLDMEYISKFLLGRKVAKLEEGKLNEFIFSFEEFNVYSWIAKFDLYDGQNISLKSISQAKKDNQAFVNILVQEDDSSEVFDLQFRIRKSDGKYKIADIKVVGVSMLLTYKKEFRALNKQAVRDGIDEFTYLLDFIKEKTEKMKVDYLK